MLTKQEILDQKLIIYIHVGENKEGVPQFRKVRHPEAVDVTTGQLHMWVEDIHMNDQEELMRPVAMDPANPPTPPAEISVQATLREFNGHVILFDSNGKKIDETPVKKED
jgi:hypothetical protein